MQQHLKPPPARRQQQQWPIISSRRMPAAVRRRRQTRRHDEASCAPLRFATSVIFVVIILWIGVKIAIVSTVENNNNKSSRQLANAERLLKDFPSIVPDVWPNDQKDLYMGNILLSCLPDDDEDGNNNNEQQEDSTTSKCRQHGIPGSTVQRIGILRPPGILGNVMEEFVRNVVMNSASSSKSKIELIGTSYIEINHTYNKIIRFATLPMLLGTLDLVLGTIDVDNDNDSQNQITLQDVLGVVRLLIRWHCRLSSIANNSALLTLTTQMVMSHPSGVRKNIELYLGLNKHNKKKNNEQGNNSGGRTMSVEDMLDGHAGKVLHRVDECTTEAMKLLQQQQQQQHHRHRYHLLGSSKSQSHQDLLVLLQDMVDQTTEDELERGTCDDESVLWPNTTASSAGIWAANAIPKTRVTNIIGSLLLLPPGT